MNTLCELIVFCRPGRVINRKEYTWQTKQYFSKIAKIKEYDKYHVKNTYSKY